MLKKADFGIRNVRFPTYEFIALLLPVAVLILVVGFSYANLRLDSEIEEMIDQDSSKLHRISGFIGAEVSGSLNHLLILAQEPTTLQALGSQDPMDLIALEDALMTLAKRNPYYQQIRWIDESGMEKVRVMRDRGALYIVDQQDLQDKSRRYYFKNANELLPGELYISKVDLNVEHESIEIPNRPMIRIATPVVDSNRKHRGIMIINIEIRYLFNLVQDSREKNFQTNYLLLNQEGELLNSWMHNLQDEDVSDDQIDFKSSNPDVWKKLSSTESGSLEMVDGLWSWITLSPVNTFKRLSQTLPDSPEVFQQLVVDEFSLTLLAHRPVTSLVEIRQNSRVVITLGMFLVLLIYSFSLFLYLSSHVRARRAELNTTYAMAQAASMERLKELEERFRHLVEASSIGQIVVDDTGRIEISNPAAEVMLGYEGGGLKGLAVETLLPNELQQSHVQMREQYLQEPVARKMGEGRELTAMKKDGSKVPVEIGLNPYTDQGRQLVLVSIIDLSTRSVTTSKKV